MASHDLHPRIHSACVGVEGQQDPLRNIENSNENANSLTVNVDCATHGTGTNLIISSSTDELTTVAPPVVSWSGAASQKLARCSLHKCSRSSDQFPLH